MFGWIAVKSKMENLVMENGDVNIGQFPKLTLIKVCARIKKNSPVSRTVPSITDNLL
jgi:hypothetical protein